MLLTPRDRRRRRWGLAFVLGAAWLTAWGLTLLEPHLSGWGFIFYWLGTAGLAGLAFLTGLLDGWIVGLRRRALRDDDSPGKRD